MAELKLSDILQLFFILYRLYFYLPIAITLSSATGLRLLSVNISNPKGLRLGFSLLNCLNYWEIWKTVEIRIKFLSVVGFSKTLSNSDLLSTAFLFVTMEKFPVLAGLHILKIISFFANCF